jgi:hypothetical protein
MAKGRTFTLDSGCVLPVRPCRLCAYFVSLGETRDDGVFAHCDIPLFPRVITHESAAIRCAGFRFKRAIPERAGGEKGIGALITTDAKSHYETNSITSEAAE